MNRDFADSPRSILIVDDNEAIHTDFRKILSPRPGAGSLKALRDTLLKPTAAPARAPAYAINTALQGQEAVDMVRSAVQEHTPYSLAFVDMRMPPGLDGVETVERIWKEDPDIQIVFCTAYSDYSWEDLQARFGPTDRFLILKKPFDVAEVSQLASALTEKWSLERQARSHRGQLEQAVERRTLELRDVNESLRREIAQREAAEKKLRHEAFHDPLTGLPNRALLLDRLSHRIERAKRDPGAAFAVLFLDLDNFKTINDSLGHRIGDALLIEVANRIVATLRTLDTVARFEDDITARLGGDEFVVILDGIASPTNVAGIAERIQQQLLRPISIGDQELNITVSIGIALNNGACDASEMLRDADTAMYRAKHAGKARHAIFNEAMHAEAMDRLELENAIRSAIDREQLHMVYQPIVELRTGTISSFEALLRWNHPGRGLLLPSTFIPVAEEIGVIVRLGRWAMQEACRQLAAWRTECPEAREISLNVNVSKRQLSEPGFCADVERILRNSGIEPRWLNLEVTESAVISATESVEKTLQQLKQLGVSLHMDDFGTGYSSLSILHRFPFNVLKIDRSFISQMENQHSYTAVVQAIITLARNMNMTVIAEGVETRDQLPAVLALDCGFAQGFHFSEPVKANEVIPMLTARPSWMDGSNPPQAPPTKRRPATATAELLKR